MKRYIDPIPFIFGLILANEAIGLLNPSGDSVVQAAAMLGLSILGSAALVASRQG